MSCEQQLGINPFIFIKSNSPHHSFKYQNNYINNTRLLKRQAQINYTICRHVYVYMFVSVCMHICVLQSRVKGIMNT